MESFEDILKRADICIERGQYNQALAFIALAIYRDSIEEEQSHAYEQTVA